MNGWRISARIRSSGHWLLECVSVRVSQSEFVKIPLSSSLILCHQVVTDPFCALAIAWDSTLGAALRWRLVNGVSGGELMVSGVGRIRLWIARDVTIVVLLVANERI